MNKIQYKGVHSYRLQDSSNKKEILFNKAWKDLNKNDPDFIAELLMRQPTNEDIEAMSTILQWLGTSYGFLWLEKITDKCRGMISVN